MVSYISFLTSITLVVIASVKLPNGNQVLVTHIGTVKISISLILDNVLCVLSFSFNFLSVPQLTKLHYCYLFFIKNFYIIQDLSSWRMIGLGKLKHGLYYLLQNSNKFASTSFVDYSNKSDSDSCNFSFIVSSPTSFGIWHYRLGHMSSVRESLLQKYIPYIQVSSYTNCEICLLAKNYHLSFPLKQNNSTYPFQIIYYDI